MPYADPAARYEYQRQWRAKNLEKVRASARQYQRANKAKQAEWRERCVYGMALGERKKMFDRQLGLCAMGCGTTISLEPHYHTHIDHDHTTGRVRGLLCRRCNIGLSYVEDVDFARRAREYLDGTR